MSANLKEIAIRPIANAGDESLMEKFKGRASQEVVIAFAGPIGSATKGAITESESILKARGYEVVRIKLSKFISEQLKYKKVLIDEVRGHTDEGRKYHQLQTAGNELRKTFGNNILGLRAVAEIALHRAEQHPDVPVEDVVPKRTAYIIDQLKHPDEVHFLRTIYRNLFYLVGVTGHISTRQKRMRDSGGFSKEDVVELTKRDSMENFENGQQLEKTMKLADFFVNSDPLNVYEAALKRFFGLLHRVNASPTREEYGMYLAYAAAARSLCISRQVGAALVSRTGAVLSTGRNDVPKAHGGLYEPGDELGSGDMRCAVHGGFCRNKDHKIKLKDEMTEELRAIKTSIQALTNASDADLAKIVDALYRKSQIENLIEFSRSVHAEMDAIIEAARMGVSVQDASLYTTTFPCHSCARHIVAAGIMEVFYIEPYPKSLAYDLHRDSIAFDHIASETDEPDGKDADAEKKSPKVVFKHFSGVAPRQYLSLFQSDGERKDADGRVVPSDGTGRVSPEFLDSYKDFETQATKKLNEINGLYLREANKHAD